MKLPSIGIRLHGGLTPSACVQLAKAAEQAGFAFEVCSDHYFPWLDAQGHAPYAWSVLGAVAHATERVELMTYVTCPTFRYHPVVVAQQAATMGLLSGSRFTLGLGSGENLNEHVVGWAGRRSRCATKGLSRRWASSTHCLMAVTSPFAASITKLTRQSCGTCPRGGCRSQSQYRVLDPAGRSHRWVTT